MREEYGTPLPHPSICSKILPEYVPPISSQPFTNSVNQPAQLPDEWSWSVYKTVDTSITQFLDTLSPITKTINLDGTAPTVAANLVFAHVLTCHAGIELHGMFANDDPNEYQKCMYYARRIMKVVYDIQDTDSSLWHLMVGVRLFLLFFSRVYIANDDVCLISLDGWQH